MKKQVLIIISIVVIICSFVACTHNSGSETASTTAVTDSNGITHYYEPVTDENNEIVTKENGDVVTTEITAKIKPSKTNATSTYTQNKADNVIDFETVINATTSNSTTEAEKIITTTNHTTTEKAATITQSNTTASKSTTITTTTQKQITTTTSKLTTNPTTKKQTQLATDKNGWINKWY